MALSAAEVKELKQAPAAEEVLPVFRARWSPRSFSDRAVSAADLRKVFEAARWALQLQRAAVAFPSRPPQLRDL